MYFTMKPLRHLTRSSQEFLGGTVYLPAQGNLPTLQILQGETHPHTYYGFQNDSQDPFHQSRKPVGIVLGLQVGIHDVSFAGRAESEKVRTSQRAKVTTALLPRQGLSWRGVGRRQNLPVSVENTEQKMLRYKCSSQK